MKTAKIITIDSYVSVEKFLEAYHTKTNICLEYDIMKTGSTFLVPRDVRGSQKSASIYFFHNNGIFYVSSDLAALMAKAKRVVK